MTPTTGRTGGPPRLTLEQVRQDFADGTVDTVILAFTDMQGRLQGKRLHGHFFLDHVLDHGTEGCNYLLAVDVDMNTVEGYDMAGWERGYGDFVLKPELDTRTKEGKLMVTFMSGLAEFERDLLIERTKDGVAHARAEGRVAGPKPKLSPEQVRLARKAIEAGESVTAVARSLGVSRQTLYRALERHV